MTREPFFDGRDRRGRARHAHAEQHEQNRRDGPGKLHCWSRSCVWYGLLKALGRAGHVTHAPQTTDRTEPDQTDSLQDLGFFFQRDRLGAFLASLNERF